MIDPTKFEITVITPTIGRNNLLQLIKSIRSQTIANKIFHLIMWDDFRERNGITPQDISVYHNHWSIELPWGLGKNGAAPGSALRAVAMVAAFTPYVTFADDDVILEPNHFETMLEAIQNKNWSCCKRKIYSPIDHEYLGIDNFESVGDSPSRKVPYTMLDGNTMMFRREFGVIASQFYRETKERNDDRLMYQFLSQHAGPLGRTELPTVNHICPDYLIEFFRNNCEK